MLEGEKRSLSTVYGYTNAPQNCKLKADIAELKKAGASDITFDMEGNIHKRPALDELTAQLKPKDTLILPRMSVVGMDVVSMMIWLFNLIKKGVYINVLGTNFNTTLPGFSEALHQWGADLTKASWQYR